jgi:ABC-2 type transport system permease protein
MSTSEVATEPTGLLRSETLRGVWVVGYREVLRFVSDRSRVFGSLFFPLLLLVIFGAGFSELIGAITPGVDYVQFLYPGILSIMVLTSSLNAGVSVVADREYGFLREILVAPLSRTGIVLGKTAGATLQALLQTSLLLVLAPLLGVSLTPAIVLALVPIIAILSTGLAGLGILLASFIRSQQGFQLLGQVVIFPLIFLAGVFFPVNQVSPVIEVISKLNPLTYGVDAVRQVLLGDAGAGAVGVTLGDYTTTIAVDLLIVSAMSALLLAAAIWAFNRRD